MPRNGIHENLKKCVKNIESFGRFVSHVDTTECHIIKPELFCVPPGYNLLPSFV